jgi:hypothetical protein
VDYQRGAGHAVKECAVARLGVRSWLEPALRPGFAALERAPLGYPPVERVHDPPTGGRANGVAPLGIPAFSARPPYLSCPTLRSARHQNLQIHHFTLTVINHY